MKKKLTFFIIIFSIVSSAQNISLKWAEKIPTKDQFSILGGKNGKYYTTHLGEKRTLVGRVYDKNLKLLQEKQIAFNLADKKYNYRGAYFVDGKILHFIGDDARKKGEVFMYSSFTDGNLNTSEKVLVLDQSDQVNKTFNFGTRTISPDSTKVLIYHDKIGKKKAPQKLIYKVYNSSITEIVAQGEVSVPIKSKNYSTKLVRVDNFGNVYLLAEINKVRKEKKKGMSKYYFKLIVFTKDKSVKEFDFDYPSSNISFIDMIPSKDNKFFCSGFLTPLKVYGKKKWISDEMFFSKIDCKTLTLEQSKKIKVNGIYPKRSRLQDAIPYKIRDIFQKKDGGYSIVAEQYIFRASNYEYISIYGDIVNIQTNKNLDVTSLVKVPKFQKNALNPSIISTFKNDKTYIVYEDVASNVKVSTDKKIKKNRGSFFASRNKNALFILTVDTNGKMKKEIIYNYKGRKIMPRIFSSVNLGEGKILLNAKDQLGLIEIE